MRIHHWLIAIGWGLEIGYACMIRVLTTVYTCTYVLLTIVKYLLTNGQYVDTHNSGQYLLSWPGCRLDAVLSCEEIYSKVDRIDCVA